MLALMLVALRYLYLANHLNCCSHTTVLKLSISGWSYGLQYSLQNLPTCVLKCNFSTGFMEDERGCRRARNSRVIAGVEHSRINQVMRKRSKITSSCVQNHVATCRRSRHQAKSTHHFASKTYTIKSADCYAVSSLQSDRNTGKEYHYHKQPLGRVRQ